MHTPLIGYARRRPLTRPDDWAALMLAGLVELARRAGVAALAWLAVFALCMAFAVLAVLAI